MPRKLKVFTTSIGFFDLAIAAPSMKAALEAWGADSNLFHQNFAKEVHDADIVDVAMAHPGVVLKRPVGSNKRFAETSDLPNDLAPHASRSPASQKGRRSHSGQTVKSATAHFRKASAAYERQERKRQVQEQQEETKRSAVRKRREAAVKKAEQRLIEAEAEHDGSVAAIADERAKIDARERAEDDRWNAAKRKLQTALTKAKPTN